jgi:succinate dehydrogenase/fumarate reductase iron-sulfur protein
MEITVKIQRYKPEKDKSYWKEYTVKASKNDTILGVLIKAREEDSSLAFRYGCRYKHCGLCSVMVNGKPKIACLTKAREGDKIEPLKHLNIIRDLIVEREFVMDFLVSHDLHIQPEPSEDFKQIVFPEEFADLARCNDCLSCIATCENYSGNYEPWSLVKIATVQFHPYNKRDLSGLVEKLDLTKCSDCKKCYCLHGINIRKHAIEALISEQ